MFESGVGAQAAGARDVAEAAEGAGVFGGYRTAVPANRSYTTAVAQGQFGDLGDVGSDGPQLGGVGQRLQRDRAGADGAAQQPMPGDGGVEPQQLFADALSVRVGECESDVVGQRAQVGDVVVEPFEFDEQRPQPVHLVGEFDPERVFDGEAVGERVRDGGVAADAFGQVDRAVGRPAVEELFQAAVDEPQSGLEPQHGFAGDGEAEMAGFDQPGVHGADRDLIHPGSVDGDERETGQRLANSGAGPASLRIGYQSSGQWACRTSRRGLGCPTGRIPYRSAISRSNRPAGNDRYASERTAGSSCGHNAFEFDAAIGPAGQEQVDDAQARRRRRGPPPEPDETHCRAGLPPSRPARPEIACAAASSRLMAVPRRCWRRW